MRGATLVLGLVACAAALQYPQSLNYGRQGLGYDDDLLGGIYNRLHGPYSTQFYQKRFGQGYSGQDYQKASIYDQLADSEEYRPISNPNDDQNQNQRLYGANKGLYDKYSSSIYNKYLNKFYNYLNKRQEQYNTGVEEDEQEPVKNVNSELTKKQQHVYQLVRFINNPVYDKEFLKVYSTFSLEKYADNYKTEAYERFIHLWRNQAYLPKGSIFSVMNDEHVKQVQALFDLFYTAKDYETFYKTAVWARQHVNEGMFLYTYSVALVHRTDTQGLALPAIYELNPQYFFNSEVIQKAYKHKMSHFGGLNTGKSGIYTIRTDYSGNYLNLNPEQSLSYFTEDVGINAFYYYYNLYFPYWMDSDKYQLDENRGELFYYVHQQLLARYYLERLSHGIGGFDFFNWDVPFETGYYPSLTYPNGLAFNERPNFANLQEYFHNYGHRWCFVGKYGYGYTYVNTYEQRIREAIDLGYAYSQDGQRVDLYNPKGLNILANIIEGNADSPNYRYYGSYVNFARHLLGYSKQPLDNFSLAPSVLEHFETSMRDPAFYKLAKKMLLLFQKYKVNLPEYTEKDLYYPGVKVDRLEVEPLVTFYEQFHTDITNGLTVTPDEYESDSTFRVQVEQYRLNHKNFNYKVYVDSELEAKANVRVFIGPKFDEHGRTIDFLENRNNFVELDQFVYNLKSGENVIVRNSRDFLWFGGDKTSYLDLYKQAMTGDFQKVYKVDDFMNGFPRRYMLPRGSAEGTTYQIYVIVSPYKPQQSEQTQKYYQTRYNQETVFTAKQVDNEDAYDKMEQYKMVRIDSYPLGYPFDRPAEFQQTYFVPNAKMIDVKVYHQVLRRGIFETEGDFEEKPKYFM
ncbi:arylphorin subunit alpha-like [Harmonia axyridis]|uniref:arylphorin subunit alpha-like n=1 Tax=Harmonia axyridis TaxID=115357 RepID=UPI001E279630|nr:arylphorin subunit alpha-like [Harmonia axyridis]